MENKVYNTNREIREMYYYTMWNDVKCYDVQGITEELENNNFFSIRFIILVSNRACRRRNWIILRLDLICNEY